MEYQEAVNLEDGNSVEMPKKPGLFDRLKSGNAKPIEVSPFSEVGEIDPPKRKRGRPKKIKSDNSSDVESTGNEVATNKPYIESYDETNNLIKIMIGQIDGLQGELKQEFNDIRASKMRGKYQYLNDISSTISSLASTKLQAIKELNSVITNAHKMELSRTKELKLDQTGNDDAAIMGLYENIINTPRQDLNQGFMPQLLEGGNIPLLVQPPNAMEIIQPMEVSDEFTPEQNRMIIESNPDIKTVVVYDPKNETREFKMINTSTGQYVDNVSLPDPFLLEDMNLNFQTGIARNSNVNMNFPLVVLESGVPNFIGVDY